MILDETYYHAMRNCVSILKRDRITNSDNNYILLTIRVCHNLGMSTLDAIGKINESYMHQSGYKEEAPLSTDWYKLIYNNRTEETLWGNLHDYKKR